MIRCPANKSLMAFLILLSMMAILSSQPAQVKAQAIAEKPTDDEHKSTDENQIYLPYVSSTVQVPMAQPTGIFTSSLDSVKIAIEYQLPEWQPPRSYSASPNQMITYDSATGQEMRAQLSADNIPSVSLQNGRQSSDIAGSVPDDTNHALLPAAPDGAWGLSRVDESQYPWRAVVRLEIEHDELPSNRIFVCSGILIDPKIVLTQGNCVYNNSSGYGWATNIRAIPGYEDGSEPVGAANDIRLHSVNGWVEDYNFDYDYGFVILDRPIGRLTGWAGYAFRGANSFFTTTTFQNPGYPGGGAYNLKLMYNRSGTFASAETFSVYRSGVDNGMWGSNAIFPHNNSYNAIAILSHTRGNDTGYTRITESKFDFIKARIEQYTPSTPDLVPLRFRVSPTTITAGSTPTSMSFVLHNYSSQSWDSSTTYEVCISSNETISKQDRCLSPYTYQGNIAPKKSVLVNVPSTAIPVDLRGAYYMGVVLNSNDADTNNNDSSGWDAARITISSPPPAVFTIDRTSLSFAGTQGKPITKVENLRLTFDGVTGTSWTATTSANWIKLDKRSGTGSTTVGVSVDTTGLGANVPDGTIQFNAPGANPSSRTVTVKLDLTPPQLEIEPTTIQLNATLGEVEPATETFAVGFSGGVSAPWRAEASVDWLRLSPTSGTGTTQVTVTPDILGLPEGSYPGEVAVIAEDTDEVRAIAITLMIGRGQGQLVVNPTVLTFPTIANDPNPSTQTIRIDNQIPGDLAWMASTNQPWLTLDQAAGQTPHELGVTVDTRELDPGEYTGQITIVGPEVPGSEGEQTQQNQTENVTVKAIVVDRNESQPLLQVSPPFLQFTAIAGSDAPAPQFFTIDNIGGGTLNWTATTATNWLTIGRTQGTNEEQVRVTVNPASLEPGTHTGTITINAPNAEAGTQTVNVLLTLRRPPTLAVDGTLLIFSAIANGENPAAKNFTVRNQGEGILNWSAAENIPWLTVTNNNGTTPATVRTMVDIQGLAPGVHEGVITVQSEGVAGSPKSIRVKLYLQPGPVLALYPQTLYLDMEAGEVKTFADEIDIKNASRGILVWQASESIPWLTVNNPSGNTPAFARNALAVAVDTRQLEPREQPYTGQILVQSENGEGSPQTVNTVLTVFSKARYCRIPAGGSDYVINTSRVKMWMENVQITPTADGGCRLTGTMRVNLPQNANLSFNVAGQVDAENKFTASASINLDLGIADIGLSLAEEFTITDELGLVSNGGRWKLPPKFGNQEHGFNGEIRIGPSGLAINGSRDFDFPDLGIGGFTMTNNRGKVEFSTDGKFLLHLSGDLKLAIAGTGTVTTRVTLVLDQRGIRTGSVQNFTIRGLAGLDLDIIDAKMEGDRLKVATARLKVPQSWGGGQVALYGLSIWNDGSVSISGGKFRLPEINAGGDAFKLSSLEGEFFSLPGGGYEIQARGKFGLSGVGEAGNCVLWVDVTLQTGAGGTSIMHIASQEGNEAVMIHGENSLSPRLLASPGPQQTTLASTAAMPAALETPETLRLKRLVVGLRCRPGWPIGTTGFNFTGVEGTIELGSGIEKIKIKVWIESEVRFGDTAAVMMVPEATIRPKPFAIDFRSPVYVMGLKTQETVVGIDARRFHTEMLFNYVIFHAGIGYEAGINAANKFYVQGNGWGEISVEKGSIYEKCITYPAPTLTNPGRKLTSCISVPPSSVRLARADAYIDLQGVDVSVKVAGYRATARFDFSSGTLSVRRGVLATMITHQEIVAAQQRWAAAERGEVVATAADSRFAFTPRGDVTIALPVAPSLPQLQAAASITNTTYITDYDLNVQSDVVFAMIQPPEGLLALRLIAPDGREITPDDLPGNVTYEQRVGISETQTIYNVTAAMPAIWRLKVTGDIENTPFFVFQVENTPPPGLEKVVLNAGNTANTMDITWNLRAAEENTRINIYANSGPITKTVAYTDSSGALVSGITENFVGIPIAEDIVSATDGAPQQYSVDLTALPSGDYTFWIEAVGSTVGSRRCYARSDNTTCSTANGAVALWSVDNRTTFPNSWDAEITTITDIKAGEMAVAWSPLSHPDLESYLLRVRSTDPLSPTLPIERVYEIGMRQRVDGGQHVISNIEPGQTYQLAVGAKRTDVGQIVWSDEVSVATGQPEFLLSTSANQLEVTAGRQAVAVTLNVEMADTLPYPVIFDLDYERLADGLYIDFTEETIAASTTSVSTVVAQITAADGVHAGRYVVPIIARSGLLQRELTIPLVVTTGTSSTEQQIYLPLIAR